jgi:hypothetical protein
MSMGLSPLDAINPFASILGPILGGGVSYFATQQQSDLLDRQAKLNIENANAASIAALQSQAIAEQNAIIQGAQQRSQQDTYIKFALIGVGAIGGLMILRYALNRRKNK